MSISQIILGLILGFLFFITTEKVSIIRRFKDSFEKLLRQKVTIITAQPFVITAATIITNTHGYIAVNSAAQQAYSSCAPPAAPPETPARPNLSDYDYLQNLIATAFIPFYQDINNNKTELILSDHYIAEYIASKTAEAILFYNYQTLAITDFQAFEKKVFLEINRKLSTIYSVAEKYKYDANAVKLSSCKPLLKKAILSYLTYFNIRLQSLDAPILSGDSADKKQTLYDFIDNDIKLNAGEAEDDIIDIDSETALPLYFEDETPAPKLIAPKVHRQPRQAQNNDQLNLFAFAGGAE